MSMVLIKYSFELDEESLKLNLGDFVLIFSVITKYNWV